MIGKEVISGGEVVDFNMSQCNELVVVDFSMDFCSGLQHVLRKLNLRVLISLCYVA